VNKTCIIYTRVSTDEQADKGYSLQHQVSECRRYAIHNGFSILEEISDDYSGATLERPGFSYLRKFIAQNHVDAVIMYTADRLSRNVVDFFVLRDQWAKAEIEMHFVDRGRSQNNFEGLLTDGIFAIIAHGERLQIIQRTTNGKHNKAKDNRMVMSGIGPYGYKKRGMGRDAEYVIDEFQAEVVRNIFDWYVNGYENKGPLSLRRISNILDELGIMPPNNRKDHALYWHPRTIALILKNPIYTGITHYGRTRNENGKRIPKPQSEWTLIKVPHLAIVSSEIFEEAKKRLLRNKEHALRNRKRAYLMSVRLFCGTCGDVMTGFYKKFPRGGGKSYYRCFRISRKRGTCNAPKRQLSVARIDTAVWEWVTALLEDESNLDEGIRAMMERKEREWEPKKERLETIKALMQDAQAKVERLVDELSDYEGFAVRDVIREKIRSLENKNDILAEEAERLVRDLEENDLTPDFEERIKRTAAIIRQKISGATMPDKHLILDALDLKAYYSYEEGRGEILKITCLIPSIDGQIVLPLS
jgi:site-specific DNA recombinase